MHIDLRAEIGDRRAKKGLIVSLQQILWVCHYDMIWSFRVIIFLKYIKIIFFYLKNYFNISIKTSENIKKLILNKKIIFKIFKKYNFNRISKHTQNPVAFSYLMS